MLRNAVKIILLALGAWVLLRFLWAAQQILLVTFLGVVLGLAMSRPVDWLERLGIRRGLGATLVLLAVIGFFVALGALIAPQLRDQTRSLSTQLPKAIDSIEQWLNQTPAKLLGVPPPQAATQQQTQTAGAQGTSTQHAGAARAQTPQTPKPQTQGPQTEDDEPPSGSFRTKLGEQFQSAVGVLFPNLSSTFGALAGLVILLFVGMYIAAEPRLYRAGLVHLIPHHVRDRGEQLLDTIATALRSWLVARLLAMIAVGTITTFGLMLLDIEAAIALGVLAGLLELIPFFGPILSAVPAIGVAFLEGPDKVIWVLVLYTIIQQLEGNLITPLILEKRLDIPPVLTIVTVAALGIVFGVLGMLAAEPLLAVGLVIAKMLYVQDVVGDDVPVRGQE